MLVEKYEDHCNVVDIKTEQSFLIESKNIDKQLYIDKEEALRYLRTMQEKDKDVKVYRKVEECEE